VFSDLVEYFDTMSYGFVIYSHMIL